MLFDEIHLCFLKSFNVKDSLIIIKVVVLYVNNHHACMATSSMYLICCSIFVEC